MSEYSEGMGVVPPAVRRRVEQNLAVTDAIVYGYPPVVPVGGGYSSERRTLNPGAIQPSLSEKQLQAKLQQETQRANDAERRARDAERRAADAEKRLRELTGGSSTTYRSTTPSSAPSYVPQSVSVPALIKSPGISSDSFLKFEPGKTFPPTPVHHKTDLEYTCAKINYDAFKNDPLYKVYDTEQRMSFLKQNKSHIARLVALVGSVYAQEIGQPQMTPFDEQAYIVSRRGTPGMVLRYDKGVIYVPATWPTVPMPMDSMLKVFYDRLGGINSELGFPRSILGVLGFEPFYKRPDAARMNFENGEIVKSSGSFHPLYGKIRNRWSSESKANYWDGWLPTRSILTADGKLVSVTFENGKTFTA